jgi:3-phenylpropionate/trans-cinnamate dioxygenase ferredoxin component
MSKLTEVAKVNELADGAMKHVVVHGRDILLARVKGKYYAAENRCPHMGGSLSDGKLHGTVVTCPRHLSQFDLVNGHVLRWTGWSGLRLSIAKMLKSPRSLAVYKITVENGKLFLEL